MSALYFYAKNGYNIKCDCGSAKRGTIRYQKKIKDINGSTAKQIRKRISKLKSELKNSMNFFQKTKLQQEISNLEKVYKKLNKKEKEAAQAKQRAINFYNSI